MTEGGRLERSALAMLASPALAGGSVRCTTYEKNAMQRLQTLCSDGTRATSYWSPTLRQWQTTVTPPPGQTCTGRLNPGTGQVGPPGTRAGKFTFHRISW